MTETFKTLLKNSRKDPVTIYEADGTPLVTLGPSATFQLETDDPLSTFARWAEVEFVCGPRWTKLVQRAGWEEPDHGRWPTEFINVGGKRDPEYRTLHHMTLCLMRGIPVTAGLDLLDDYITYERIEVGKPKQVRKPSADFDGIVEVHWEVEDERHLRPQSDLLTIQQEIERLTGKGLPSAPDDVEFS